MKKRDLLVGEIVQIEPTMQRWGSCLMTVTEPATWGARGYVQTSHGQEFVNVKFQEMEQTGGRAEWATVEDYENMKPSALIKQLAEAVKTGRDALAMVLSPAIDQQLPPSRSQKAHAAIDELARAYRAFTSRK